MNRCLIVLACLGPWAGIAAAHPVVPGFERFFTGKDADAVKGGRLLLGELSCVSCHQSSPATAARKQAPVLDEVGSRVRAGAGKSAVRIRVCGGTRMFPRRSGAAFAATKWIRCPRELTMLAHVEAMRWP